MLKNPGKVGFKVVARLDRPILATAGADELKHELQRAWDFILEVEGHVSKLNEAFDRLKNATTKV